MNRPPIHTCRFGHKCMQSSKLEAFTARTSKHFTPEQRAKVGRYAAEDTNAAAVRKFSDEFESLGESNVRLFKKAYLSKLSKGGGTEVKELPKKKRGRPLTLGELDGDVQRYLNAYLNTLFRIWTELKTH